MLLLVQYVGFWCLFTYRCVLIVRLKSKICCTEEPEGHILFHFLHLEPKNAGTIGLNCPSYPLLSHCSTNGSKILMCSDTWLISVSLFLFCSSAVLYLFTPSPARFTYYCLSCFICSGLTYGYSAYRWVV